MVEIVQLGLTGDDLTPAFGEGNRDGNENSTGKGYVSAGY